MKITLTGKNYIIAIEDKSNANNPDNVESESHFYEFQFSKYKE